MRTINPGDLAFSTFSWTPSSAKTSLTFRVSCDDIDADYADNELTHQRAFKDPQPSNGMWAWTVVLLLACFAVALHLVGRRDRDKESD